MCELVTFFIHSHRLILHTTKTTPPTTVRASTIALESVRIFFDVRIQTPISPTPEHRPKKALENTQEGLCVQRTL